MSDLGAGRTAAGRRIAVRVREHGPPTTPTRHQNWEVCGKFLARPLDGFHNTRERRYRQGEYSATGCYEDAYDYQALIECLLRPLSGSAFPVLCRRVSRDVRTDLPDTAPPIAVGTNTVLLFEGLFLFRSQINDYWNLRILLDVSADESISRAVARDTGVIGTADIVRKKYTLRSEPAWRLYIEEASPGTKADWIIDNEDIRNPWVVKPGRKTITKTPSA